MSHKLNKREQLAFDTLIALLVSMKDGAGFAVSEAEHNAIKNTFGIDLKAITYRKKDIDTFVRGKDGHLVFIKPFSAWHPANSVNAHGYFPYQVKTLKSTEGE